jgi:hypothetical protein
MIRVVSILFILLLPSTFLVAQKTDPQVILDVKASGFKIEPVGQHIYMRVYDNGVVAYDDYKPSIRAFYLYESRLSPTELASLKDFLQAFASKDIAPSYRVMAPLKDITRYLKITNVQPNKIQTVEILSPRNPEGQGSPPAPLIAFICTIEKMRKDASLRLVDMRTCRG